MSVDICKFMVVLYRRADFTPDQFQTYLREVHGPMAERLPGLRRYVQNHVVSDPFRRHPGWDAVVELYWENREAMERAWSSPEGEAATADLEAFADLSRTSWYIVDADVRR